MRLVARKRPAPLFKRLRSHIQNRGPALLSLTSGGTRCVRCATSLYIPNRNRLVLLVRSSPNLACDVHTVPASVIEPIQICFEQRRRDEGAIFDVRATNSQRFLSSTPQNLGCQTALWLFRRWHQWDSRSSGS